MSSNWASNRMTTLPCYLNISPKHVLAVPPFNQTVTTYPLWILTLILKVNLPQKSSSDTTNLQWCRQEYQRCTTHCQIDEWLTSQLSHDDRLIDLFPWGKSRSPSGWEWGIEKEREWGIEKETDRQASILWLSAFTSGYLCSRTLVNCSQLLCVCVSRWVVDSISDDVMTLPFPTPTLDQSQWLLDVNRGVPSNQQLD